MSNNRNERRIHLHGRGMTYLLMAYDAFAVNISYFLALWLRFDCRFGAIGTRYLNAWKSFTLFYTLICLIVFYFLKLYRSIWRYASYAELQRTISATVITGILHTTLITAFFTRMPLTYYVLGPILQFILITSIRFAYRFVLLVRTNRTGEAQDRIMVIGAGASGQGILRDIHLSEKVKGKAVCVIDDDPSKWHKLVENVEVVGGRDLILASVEKYKVDKIYLAIPSATAQQRRDILEICKETGCELKNLPGMYQLMKGDVYVSNMKDVSVEDLLGREPIRADLEEVYQFITGKRVLVTGGGGSIGSELCRQIAAHKPSLLVIFDVYENNAYDIQLELKEKYPYLDIRTIIGSVRDSRKVFQLFEEYRPQLVYHAAAHKHVPLMEDSPCEAIKNNTIGTYKTAYAAMVNGCERFVLISTDKAVNPTNIMGASKRLCEMVIQGFDKKVREGKAEEIPQLFTHPQNEKDEKAWNSLHQALNETKTEFVAVRFGNVLGSNGSVIPVFKRQIEKGGPVTVTHPDIIRYFMTIPEAVSLVLAAGTYAKGGEIYVLDMGSPVKIDTLARNLIRLSGLKPDEDIKIEYTGLRPGEKLYEEKLMGEEGLKKTPNELLFIGQPIPFETDTFFIQLRELMNMAYLNRRDIRKIVAEMVSTYHPDGMYGTNINDPMYQKLVDEEDE